MIGFAKSILITILVSVCIILFINLSLFFPWYITLVTETFQLTQAVASDNYLKQSYYYDTLDRLRDRPIFRDKKYQIEIEAMNSDRYDAIGYNDESYYFSLSEYDKPYRQRGEPVTITIKAVYPLTITLWGRQLEQEIPVSFSMTTTGLKHYKDLDYYKY